MNIMSFKLRLKCHELGLIFSLVLGLMLIPMTVNAGPGLPFGGQVLYVVPCACSANFLIVNRPIGLSSSAPYLIFGPGSIPYSFFSHFIPGSYIMGTYTHVEPCVVWVGVCVPYPPAPAGFKIFMIGSSLPGV